MDKIKIEIEHYKINIVNQVVEYVAWTWKVERGKWSSTQLGR